ncbi:MAG: DUF4290 domain-containing protein [Bacteroidales bacterium]|jgi:hypothetical protein|nr:DUF4290 domain-containing protein [Bacteroidales bacterium]
MEYNTSQKKLILPEYGRHVHLMVQYAIQIQDRNQRNIAAHTIIGVMGSLMPHLRETPDFKHKLWDHLFIISEFKLKIDAPYPPPLSSEMVKKPNLVSYPKLHIRLKHYGQILVDMIHKAGKMPDSPQRDALVQLLVTQMRKSYTAWNRCELDSEQIIQDIWDISDGKILLKPESVQFTEPVMKEKSQVAQGKAARNRKKKLVGSSRK